MRLSASFLLTVSLALVPSSRVARAEEPVLKYFVDVPVPSMDAAARLAADGFDVAGVDRDKLTVGIVATQDELDRLKAMGWPVTMRGNNAQASAVAALADYTDPQELSVFIDQVVAAHPDLAKKIILKDTLFEAQKQYAVLITKDVGLPNERPAFILDAQHHAREVMTPEIAKDMIDYLTSRYATDAQVRRWVDGINIYVVPSVNPDGAMAVFTGDTFWRKNRRPFCPVDVNRNYPALWASCNGSSADCNSETTRGSYPGSEPETQGMMQLTEDVRPMFSLSYHSYGELLMYPYGCSDPDERAAFDDVALGLKAILVNDRGFAGGYAAGPIWSTIYLADGTSVDTQYSLFGVYGYTIEVNSGVQGFQPAYSPWRTATVVRQRTAWTYFLDKTLDAPQIRMTVTDAATGLPMPADVTLQEVTFTHGETQRRADAGGRHRFLVHGGATYHVSASYPAYCTATQSAAVGFGPATVDIALTRPDVPQGVVATGAGDNAIDVSWQPTAHSEQYRVLRALNAGGPYTAVATLPGTATSFHDASVSSVVTYYYVVRGIQGCESIDSAETQASTSGFCSVGPLFQGASTVVNAGTETCALTVHWPLAAGRCGGAITYDVYRSPTAPFAPGPANLVASGIAGQSFVDHGALAGETDYFYVVRAVDAHNNADDGNMAAVSGFPTGPDALGTWTDDAGDTGRAKMTTQPPWSVAATGGNAGPHVYATGIYPNNVCAELTSPPITLGANSILTFASKWDIETYYDAGIVEIETDAWTKLPVISYPDILAYGGNACTIPSDPPEPVFSHSNLSPAYTASPFRAKLLPYAGQTIRLRWRLSSDSGASGTGWWIDDIAITNAIIPGVCAAGTAPNPKEASVDGAMKASRSSGTAVDVTYAPGCGALDSAVYWGTGPIAGAPAWTNAACALGNSGHAIFDPGDAAPGTLLYFVVVGYNGANEGSYGAATGGERPEAIGVGACDRPQILTGTCP